jgi:hypothetical protein
MAKSDRRAAPIFFGPCTLRRGAPVRFPPAFALADTDATCGEEIAQALRLISLGVDEKILALEMVGVFEGDGKSLILPSIVFQAQGFCLEGAKEAWADFVGFAIGVQDGSFFSAFGGLRLKFSYSLPIVPISRRFDHIPCGASRSSFTSHIRLRPVVTTTASK